MTYILDPAESSKKMNLNGPAVNLYSGNSSTFPIGEQAKLFSLSEGVIAAWGKCMGVHGVDAIEHGALSNMKFLYEQVKLADRIINF